MCAVVHIVANAFWLMLPAYIANSAAALFGGIFGKTPIDMRKNLGNKRILGEGKTYEGFFSGVFAGLLVGMLQEFIAPLLKMPEFTPAVLLCLSAGALLGDISASFLKRRLGLKRGHPFPLLDQLDFVAGAWLLLVLCESEWFFENFTMPVAISVLLMTPPLHLLTNFLGFKLHLKREAW